jgi:hypothetical protein
MFTDPSGYRVTLRDLSPPDGGGGFDRWLKQGKLNFRTPHYTDYYHDPNSSTGYRHRGSGREAAWEEVHSVLRGTGGIKEAYRNTGRNGNLAKMPSSLCSIGGAGGSYNLAGTANTGDISTSFSEVPISHDVDLPSNTIWLPQLNVVFNGTPGSGILLEGVPEWWGNFEEVSASGQGGKNVPGGDWDFMGKGSVPYNGKAWFGTNFVGPGPDVNPYTLKLRPVDAVDKAAQRHDYYYWKEGASGIQGALFNKNVAYADAILANDAYQILQGYKTGAIDQVTGFPISERTYNIARGVYYLFTPLYINKVLP